MATSSAIVGTEPVDQFVADAQSPLTAAFHLINAMLEPLARIVSSAAIIRAVAGTATDVQGPQSQPCQSTGLQPSSIHRADGCRSLDQCHASKTALALTRAAAERAAVGCSHRPMGLPSPP